jgi:hypothetical protein
VCLRASPIADPSAEELDHLSYHLLLGDLAVRLLSGV